MDNTEMEELCQLIKNWAEQHHVTLRKVTLELNVGVNDAAHPGLSLKKRIKPHRYATNATLTETDWQAILAMSWQKEHRTILEGVCKHPLLRLEASTLPPVREAHFILYDWATRLNVIFRAHNVLYRFSHAGIGDWARGPYRLVIIEESPTIITYESKAG